MQNLNMFIILEIQHSSTFYFKVLLHNSFTTPQRNDTVILKAALRISEQL
jgi:hypothetical protein